MHIKTDIQGAYAVINIGSNSVKLFIPSCSRFGYRNVITSRLAANSMDNGRTLDPESVERTFRAVETLVRDAKDKNVSEIFVYATEALRSASNKNLLTDRINAELNIDVDIISGEDEAKIAALGASLSFPAHSAFADIGGASTEIAVKCGERLECASFPVGAVRLDETGNDIFALKKNAAAVIRPKGTAKHIVGLGGTFSALACISLELDAFDENAVHGTVLSLSELKRLCRILQPLTPDRIVRRFPAVKPSRAKVVKAGLAIACAVAELMQADDITVSVNDGLNGYAMLLEKDGHI